jgi:polysaccharide chain length determinant protein (PEP-CTERM system associated)
VIPGKKYKPEDFLEIIWRRRWVITLPVVVCAAATFAWSWRLPDRYRSEALVLIVAPQVPENIVKPTVADSLQDRLTTMKQQILSRTRLEQIVTEFDLYRAERRTLLMDDVIARMQSDVKVNVPRAGRKREPGSFTVGFEYGEPKTAKLVAERVAALFIRENVQVRSSQADVTNQFLESQVDEARRNLQAHEAKLQAFREINSGRLPSQVQTNLQSMQNTRQQLQSLIEDINRDRDRQLIIERTIADEEALGAIVTARAPEGGNDKVPQTAAQELVTARTALAALQLKLTDEHPDVRAARRHIRDLEEKASAEALQQPVTKGLPSGPITPTDAARLRKLSALRGEFESLDRTIATKRAQVEKLQATLTDYQRRVDVAPALESQLTQLTRDYETMQGSYSALLKKAQDARVASNMEERQVGQQFRILDAPRVPERPSSPDRLRMNLLGLLAGLGLGLGIAGLLEYRDTSLRTEEDVLVAVSLPVVALVPTVWTSSERRAARRRRLLLIGTSAAATVVFSAAAIAWKLRLFGN